jgi:hypothetical protein
VHDLFLNEKRRDQREGITRQGMYHVFACPSSVHWCGVCACPLSGTVGFSFQKTTLAKENLLTPHSGVPTIVGLGGVESGATNVLLVGVHKRRLEAQRVILVHSVQGQPAHQLWLERVLSRTRWAKLAGVGRGQLMSPARSFLT